MSKNTQRPEVTTCNDGPFKGDKTSSHPAFGQISVNRFTCSPSMRMYGSEVKHSNGVNLTIYRSQENRSLNYNSYFEREMLVEISMTELQWARFISSVGQQSTPVTLNMTRSGDMVRCPDIADPEDTHKEVFADEINSFVNKAISSMQERIDRLEQLIASGSSSKKQLKEIHDDLKRTCDNLPANISFINEQFKKNQTRIIEEGKLNLEAHANSIIQNAGIKALQQSGQLQVDRNFADEGD